MCIRSYPSGSERKELCIEERKKERQERIQERKEKENVSLNLCSLYVYKKLPLGLGKERIMNRRKKGRKEGENTRKEGKGEYKLEFMQFVCE